MGHRNVNGDLLREMYKALVALVADDKVPPEIYIADYTDGTVPDWRVVGTSPGADGLVILTLEDYSNTNTPDLFHPQGWRPRKLVIACPRKILGSPVYMPEPDTTFAPNMLHDLVHNAKLHRKGNQ